MKLTEGVHYERITGGEPELVTIGDEKCCFYIAANGKWGLLRRMHPEAYDDDLLEASEEWRTKDMAEINKARKLAKKTCYETRKNVG